MSIESSQIIFQQTEQAFYHVPSLVVAPDGTVLAFCEERRGSPQDGVDECHIVLRRSFDHGKSWEPMETLRGTEGQKWHMGSAAVDEVTGLIFLMCGGGWLQSSDNGKTWQDWKPQIMRPKDGMAGSTHGSGPGITLKYGRHKDRIVWPARTVDKRQGYDDRRIQDRQTKCFSTVLYSDDHGETIQRSNVFLQGTGEACLVERLNGDILLNARAYYNDNCRYAAVSRDGGVSFEEIGPVPELRETLQGCNASMVRYPPEWIGGRDCILFANPDSVQWKRFNGTLRVSWDGGGTWHLAKRVTHEDIWFGYSSMVVGHDQFILLMHRTSPNAHLGITNGTASSSMVVVRLDFEKLMS